MHWDTKLRKKVLGSQQGSHAFYEWVLELQNQNALLFCNPAHLDNTQLCNQLEANLCDDRTMPVLRAKLASILTLKEWIEEVRHLDNKCLEDLAMHRKFAEDYYRSKECTNGAPDASTYKTLTKADTIATKPKGNKTTKPIAAVAPVAAVMPSNVMEVDFESEDDTFLINDKVMNKLGLQRRRLHTNILIMSSGLVSAKIPVMTF
ncbi:hypothetical protein BDR04DRAFT_1123035 [Suillus decipiens]|nr:hypothetical protein BDR04DRAFT_1123035 [Suillus decipiens]